jgi:hypothetical protein
MNFALFANPVIVAPLRRLVRWLISADAPALQPVAKSAYARPAFAPKLVATHAVSMGANCQNHPQSKPLRVVRVLEAGQARSSVGRMVISGRMADVCAELDRLVAREAALGCHQAS